MTLSRKIISVGIEADVEMSGQLLLVLGVDLGEPDLGIFGRRGGEHRRERAAWRAPWRPEIDDRERMIVDRLREVFAGQLDYLRHVGLMAIRYLSWKRRRESARDFTFELHRLFPHRSGPFSGRPART